MKKLRKLLILALFLIYTGGVFAGAYRAVKAPDAKEMYEYLEKGIEEYDVAAASGVKTAAGENAKILMILLAGSIFRPLFWLVAAAMLIKGYFSGFSLMAACRLYGIKGIFLCIPNLISAAVILPPAIYYGGINLSNFLGRYEKSVFYRRLLWSTIFLAAVFCADAFIKGAGFPIFVKWASKLIKGA